MCSVFRVLSPVRGIKYPKNEYNKIESVRLHGQAVKTSPFHGGNTGSIPVGVILDSSMVEHAAVNRGVVGSSPTRGVRRHSQVVRHGSATP